MSRYKDKSIELLKESLNWIEHLMDVNWRENSDIQYSSFEKFKNKLEIFLDKVENE